MRQQKRGVITIYRLSFDAVKFRVREAEELYKPKQNEAVCSLTAEALFKKPAERSDAV